MLALTIIGHFCATGGISVHIQRLKVLLESSYKVKLIDESKAGDHKGDIYNLRKGNIIKYFQIVISSNIVHIHTSIPLLRLFHVIIARMFLKKTIITIHSLSLIRSKWQIFLANLSCRMSHKVILVNNEMQKELRLRKDKIIILPAFIPPKMELEPDLPKDIERYFSYQTKKIIICNAFRLNFYQGVDLYGIDMMIDIAKRIKKDKISVFIICVITSLAVNKEIYDYYMNEIVEEALQNYIILIPFAVSFVKMIELCDLVVRPTNTDGDALTIREALYLGKPVIASDVVKRPEGTVVFKNRDVVDLYTKINTTLQDNDIVLKHKAVNYLEIYNQVYT